MSLTLVELASKIVVEHTGKKSTPNQIVEEIVNTFKTLQNLEAGGTDVRTPAAAKEVMQHPDIKKAFARKEITCLVCGRAGMKVLGRHLSKAHNLTCDDYRTQFGIADGTPLVSGEHHKHRRLIALKLGKTPVTTATAADRRATANRKASAPAEPAKVQKVDKNKTQKVKEPAAKAPEVKTKTRKARQTGAHASA